MSRAARAARGDLKTSVSTPGGISPGERGFADGVGGSVSASSFASERREMGLSQNLAGSENYNQETNLSSSRGAPAAVAAFLVSTPGREDVDAMDMRVLGRAVVGAFAELVVVVRLLSAVDVRETVVGLLAAEDVVDEGGLREADAAVDVRADEEAVPVVDSLLEAALAADFFSSAGSASFDVVARRAAVVVDAAGRVGGLLKLAPPVDVRDAEEEVGFVAVEVRVDAAGVREETTVEVGLRGGAEAPVFAAELAVAVEEALL